MSITSQSSLGGEVGSALVPSPPAVAVAVGSASPSVVATTVTNGCTKDFCIPDAGAWTPTYAVLAGKLLARLTKLGLMVEDFLFFVHLFVGHPWCYTTKAQGDTWKTIAKGRVTRELLLSHLEGTRWIGTGARKVKGGIARAHYFVIDLDLPVQEGSVDLYSRYTAVLQAVGRPTFVLRSSSEGGLHLYYFLTESVNLYRLRNPDATRGVVVRLLRAAGIEEVAGQVEIYPRNHTLSRGVSNRLRLPFGQGSRLLDSDTLLPIVGGNAPTDDLKLARKLVECGKLYAYDFSELAQRANDLSPARPKKATRKQKSAHRQSSVSRALGGVAPAEVSELLEGGLTRPGMFNASAHRLACHFVHHVDEAEARQVLGEWLDKKHNGRSTTYARNRERAHAELATIIERVYREYTGSRTIARPALSRYEARSVLETSSGGAFDPESGEELKLFKLERFGWDLVQGAKQYVLTQGTAVLRSVQDRWPQLDHDGAEFTDRVQWAARRFWPDFSDNMFVVPVPYTLRIQVPSVGEQYQAAYWRATLANGLLVPNRNASWAAHQCGLYSVRLDCGAFGSGETFARHEDAVAALFTAEDQRARYSRHFREQVKEAKKAGQTVISSTSIATGFASFALRKLSITAALACDRSAA